MTARERRRVVERVRAAAGISERRAIRFIGFRRSTMCYWTLRDPQEELKARIRELAAERPRWGIHNLLRREGWAVNRKRVQRLYREEGLAVRRRGKERRSQVPRLIREPLGRPSERWSMDFVSDTLSFGRIFRCFTIVHEYSRESLAIHVAHSIPAFGSSTSWSDFAGRGACPMWSSPQRLGVHEPCVRFLGPRPRHQDRLHPAREAGEELLRRELQRHLPRRLPKPSLVPLPGGGCPADHRGLAKRLQPLPSPQLSRRADPRGVRGEESTERGRLRSYDSVETPEIARLPK